LGWGIPIQSQRKDNRILTALGREWDVGAKRMDSDLEDGGSDSEVDEVVEQESNANDVKEIEKLVLTNPACNVPDFTTSPWNEAILVTPKHSVRNLWNEHALAGHSMETRNHSTGRKHIPRRKRGLIHGSKAAGLEDLATQVPYAQAEVNYPLDFVIEQESKLLNPVHLQSR
jgi:hypothetical protein